MNRKLPVDSFDYYYSLGPTRSYDAVAKRFGASKRSVTSLAVKERWQTKIVDLERRAREKSDAKVVDSIEEMQTRHLKTLSIVLQKALQALQRLPLDTGIEAVRAIEMVIRQERLVRGEPTDRNALDVEQLIRREYAALMVSADSSAKDGSDAA